MAGRQYDDKKKTEAVVTYLAVGKLPLVSSVVNVPVATLRQWKLQPWWKALEEEIRREDEYELDAKLSRIIDRSLDAVVERIEGGEFILNSKTGAIERVPVKLKDVHRVAVDLVDKRNLLRGKPTSRTESVKYTDTMEKLAAQFAEWAMKHMKREEKTVEGTVFSSYEERQNAVHEEREEGLPDGVQQISLQSQAEKEPSPA